MQPGSCTWTLPRPLPASAFRCWSRLRRPCDTVTCAQDDAGAPTVTTLVCCQVPYQVGSKSIHPTAARTARPPPRLLGCGLAGQTGETGARPRAAVRVEAGAGPTRADRLTGQVSRGRSRFHDEVQEHLPRQAAEQSHLTRKAASTSLHPTGIHRTATRQSVYLGRRLPPIRPAHLASNQSRSKIPCLPIS